MSIDVTEILQQAVLQLRAEKGRIDKQIGQLEALIGGSKPAAKPAAAAPVKVQRKRKPMSAAAKAEISRRMKASWAKRKRARR
jgi:hypothetical protein